MCTKHLSLLAAAVAACFSLGAQAATTYYVDGSVAASGDGSASAPYKTIAEGVTADPRFRDFAGGDYRLSGTSPCRKKGVYLSRMATATDFFGNPRANNRKSCDIGFHQTGSDSLLILVQ